MPATAYAHKRQDLRGAGSGQRTLQAMHNTGAIYEPNVEILNVTTHTNGSGNSNQQVASTKKANTMILNSPYGVS